MFTWNQTLSAECIHHALNSRVGRGGTCYYLLGEKMVIWTTFFFVSRKIHNKKAKIALTKDQNGNSWIDRLKWYTLYTCIIKTNILYMYMIYIWKIIYFVVNVQLQTFHIYLYFRGVYVLYTWVLRRNRYILRSLLLHRLYIQIEFVYILWESRV